jgi:hypothetical protein
MQQSGSSFSVQKAPRRRHVSQCYAGAGEIVVPGPPRFAIRFSTSCAIFWNTAPRLRSNAGGPASDRKLPNIAVREMSDLAITYADVMAAHQRIAGVAHRTPTLTSTTANDLARASLFFKCENLQRMGPSNSEVPKMPSLNFLPSKRRRASSPFLPATTRKPLLCRPD